MEKKQRVKNVKNAKSTKSTKSTKNKENTVGYYRMMGVALELGVVIAVLTFLGSLIDERFDTGPWWTLGGSLIGMVGGCYNMYKEFRRGNF